MPTVVRAKAALKRPRERQNTFRLPLTSLHPLALAG